MTKTSQPDADALDAEETFRLLSARVVGTNINPQTLLATDYLNHFNEIIMILEMIPDMPDCYEEAMEWQPKSYQEHFRDSQFSSRELAIEVYDHIPVVYRRPFEDVISQMNAMVAASLKRIGAALSDGQGEGEALRLMCTDASRNLQKMVDIASSIIHGSTRVLDQTEIDGFLEG